MSYYIYIGFVCCTEGQLKIIRDTGLYLMFICIFNLCLEMI